VKQEKIDHVTALAEQAANEQIKQAQEEARAVRIQKVEAAEAMAEEATRVKLEEKERIRNDQRLQKELKRMKTSTKKPDSNNQKGKKEVTRKSEKRKDSKRNREHKPEGKEKRSTRVHGSRDRRRLRKLKRRRGDRDRGRTRGAEISARTGRDGSHRKRARDDSRDHTDRGDSRDSRGGRHRDRGSRDKHSKGHRREQHRGSRDSEFEAFRDRYPMDSRAFATLTGAPPEVQNVVLNRFKPRSEGDDDYSALVMTFVRAIMNRREGGPVRRVYRDMRDVRDRQQEEDHQPDRPSRHGNADIEQEADSEKQQGHEARDDDCDASPITSFRLRYPMDDRAFSAIQQAAPAVQDVVISDFKPRREGEDDYSALVMSFVRAVQTRIGAGHPATSRGAARPSSGRD